MALFMIFYKAKQGGVGVYDLRTCPIIYIDYCQNSFVFMATEAFNHCELNGNWFEDEDSFRAVVKWRIFRSNPNGNVT